MARGLGTLTLDLIARTGGFVEGMGKAERQVRRGTRRMESDFARFSKQSRAAVTSLAKGVAVGVTAAVASLSALYVSGARSVEQLSRMSDQIGIASDDLGALRYAAQEMAGVAEGTFDNALRRMTRRITEAGDGSGPAVGALQSLRLEASELARMSPDQQFRAIADAMREIPDQGERLRATMAIFDTEGMPLVNALSQGSDAIREMEEQARLLGYTINDLDAAKVEQAQRAMGRIGTNMQVFTQQLAVQFAPVVEAAMRQITGMTDGMGGMQRVAMRVFGAVVKSIGFVADAIHGVRVVGKLLLVGFQGLGNAMIGISSRILEGWQRLMSFLVASIENVVRAANRIPGVKIPTEGLERFKQNMHDAAQAQVGMRNQMAASFQQSKDELRELVNQEMPSARFKRFIDEVQQAADEAAARAIDQRAGGGTSLPGMDNEESPASQRQAEEIERRLQALRESFYTEEEMLLEKYMRDDELLREALEQEQLTREEYEQLQLQSAGRFEDGLTAIKKRGEQARLGAIRSALSDISTLMNGESRKMFEVGKMAAIADATISMYQGIMKAWSLGPIIGPALAAMVGAVGAMNIKSIANTKFGGGTAAVSNTQAVNNAATGVNTQQQAAPERHVYLQGVDPNQWYSGGQLLDMLNGELLRGGRLMGVGA